MAEIQPGLAFVDAFANSAAVDTDDGLVIVDTSGVFHAQVGARHDPHAGRTSPLHTAVFTHGHIDHVFGVDLYEEEARANGWPPPRVDRARRDRRTLRALPHDRRLQRGDQPTAVQGAGAALADRVPHARRDVQRRRSRITVGGETFELFHDRGETDDATWVWSPDAQGAVRGRHVHLGVAELRQPAEGAALRARLGDRVPQDGRARRPRCCCPVTVCRSSAPTACSAALTEGAELLESLRRADARADERRRAPRRHRARRCARPRTCSNVRTCTRSTTSPSSSCATSGACYGGWYDGDPSHLKPAPAAALARGARRPRGRRGAARGAGARGRGRGRPAARRPSRRAGRAGRARRPGRARGPGRGVRRRGRARRRRRCRRASSRGPSTSRATIDGGDEHDEDRRREHPRHRRVVGHRRRAGADPRRAGRDRRHRRPPRRSARRGARAVPRVHARTRGCGPPTSATSTRAEQVALEAWDAFGGLDVLVNNAAIPKRTRVTDLTPARRRST